MTSPIIVLGSNSFSGATFAKTLIEAGHRVIGISRSSEPSPLLLPYRWLADQKNFQFSKLDLNKNLEEIVALISSIPNCSVVNFAAQSMVAESWENPHHWFKTNSYSTILFHERLRKLGNLVKYVHVSTPEVYGSVSGLITEGQSFNPSTPYAVSRATSDMYLACLNDQYGFPVVLTRAANIYGEGQPLYRIIPRTIYCAMTGSKLKLHGGGVSVRSFIHADDVAAATLEIMQNGENGECYHISNDDLISIKSLVELICDMLLVDFDQIVEVEDERPGKDLEYSLSSQKLRQELDWVDKVTLEEGLSRSISWFKDNFEQIKELPLKYEHKE